jgi:hypothetical protein
MTLTADQSNESGRCASDYCEGERSEQELGEVVREVGVVWRYLGVERVVWASVMLREQGKKPRSERGYWSSGSVSHGKNDQGHKK